MTENHTCPRRRENGMDRDDSPLRGSGQNLDTYTSRGGLVGQPRGCSYCGSMPPDDFMAAVKSGAEVEPTDKSYKLYVKGIPNPNPGQLYILSTSNHPSPGLRGWKDLARAEKKLVKSEYGQQSYFKDNYKERYYSFRTMTTVEAKFYTAHLSPEQGHEFYRLWMDGKVNWGYPGRPYRALYLPGPSDERRNS